MTRSDALHDEGGTLKGKQRQRGGGGERQTGSRVPSRVGTLVPSATDHTIVEPAQRTRAPTAPTRQSRAKSHAAPLERPSRRSCRCAAGPLSRPGPRTETALFFWDDASAGRRGAPSVVTALAGRQGVPAKARGRDGAVWMMTRCIPSVMTVLNTPADAGRGRLAASASGFGGGWQAASSPPQVHHGPRRERPQPARSTIGCMKRRWYGTGTPRSLQSN